MSASTAVLSSPGALVASVPYLVGFTPEESIVGVWLKNGAVMVTQRVDIGVVEKPEAFVPELVLENGATEIVLIVYGGPREDLTEERMEVFDDFLSYIKQRVSVRDVLWIHQDRWWSVLCRGPECCPPEGKLIDTSLAAELVLIGVAPVENREALKAECRPAGTTRMKTLDPHGIEGWRDKMIAEFLSTLSAFQMGQDNGANRLRKYGRALHDIRVRDVLLWEMQQVEDTRPWYEFGCEMSKEMHPDDAAPACTLTAIAAWRMGDGTRANVCLDYADQANANYSLAGLVKPSLAAGLPPQVWRETMKDLPREVCRHGDGD